MVRTALKRSFRNFAIHEHILMASTHWQARQWPRGRRDDPRRINQDTGATRPEVFLHPGEQTQISLHERSRSRSSDGSVVSKMDVLLEGPRLDPRSLRGASSTVPPTPRAPAAAYHPTGPQFPDYSAPDFDDRNAVPEPLRIRRRGEENYSQARPLYHRRPSRDALLQPPGNLSPALYHKPKDLSSMGIPRSALPDRQYLDSNPPQNSPDNRKRPRSRGRTLLNDVRRLSSQINSTPENIVWPDRSLTNAKDETSLRVVSQTLGHSRREPMVDTGISYMDLDSVLETNPRDYGRRAQLTALCGFFVTMNTWGLANAFAMFLAYYQTVLLPQHTADQLSWIGSVQLFLLFFMGAPVGICLDRGLWRVPFQGGTALLIAGMIGKGFCTRYWHFIVVEGIVVGLGMGMLFCSGAIMLMGYFEKRVGIAMAFAATGAGIGAVVHSAIFETITYSSTANFAWASRGNAFFAIITLIGPALYISPHPGIPMVKRSITLRAVSDKAFNFVIFGFWWAFLGIYFAFYFLVPYGFLLGMHGPQALRLMVALYVPNMVSRVVAGVMSDCYTGPLNMVIPSCLFTAIVTVLWIWITSQGGLFAIASFYGLVSGGLQALYSATFHSFTFKEPETMNVKSGLAYTVISLACLIGTPIGGRLVRADHNGFLAAQLFSALCLVVATVVLSLARYLKVKFAAVRI